MVKGVEVAHTSQKIPLNSAKKLFGFMDTESFQKLLKEKVDSEKWRYHKEADMIEFSGFLHFFLIFKKK